MSRRAPDRDDRVSPRRQQPRRRRAGGTGTDHRDINARNAHVLMYCRLLPEHEAFTAMKRSVTPELIVLTALSALTHFWRLFTPNAVVFDEMHFKHHAGRYIGHTHYFDVHPPLAKLLYALEARIAGISA